MFSPVRVPVTKAFRCSQTPQFYSPLAVTQGKQVSGLSLSLTRRQTQESTQWSKRLVHVPLPGQRGQSVPSAKVKTLPAPSPTKQQMMFSR